ncbi:MAG: glycosyltransferase [Bacteroidota bacterium]
MTKVSFSFVVPVYNRPQEIQELLESVLLQEEAPNFEVVIVEDGSQESSEAVVAAFKDRLNISYYQKPNTGPGDSRNYGMERANGNYYLILDSDCLLPSHYLAAVSRALSREFVHCFGGADASHPSFSNLQKAIDHSMTSFWTTGGLRGHRKQIDRFQPRSFNMGLSQEAFQKTGGFGTIHPGEDPDLTFRIWQAGYQSRFFPEAFVFHKRRISWSGFYRQVRKFGMVRPILNQWHPKTARLTYWFPSCFVFGSGLATLMVVWNWWWPLLGYGIYLFLVFIDALRRYGVPKVALLSLFAVLVQFYGYGTAFFKSTVLLTFTKKAPEALFPQLFFKK